MQKGIIGNVRRLLAGLLLGGLALPASASDRYYEVTVTNITRGEIFTPILVATHRAGMRLFKPGSPAGSELEQLAEGGDTMPLAASLKAAGALDVVTGGDVLPPGASMTLKVRFNRRHRHISLASMLVPSNDAFIALNGIAGPRHHGKTLMLPAWDAGTEDNDELCVSIPGPPFLCQGQGYAPGGGEGYVYIHGGIHGVGDLSAAGHDWRNPVARVSIRVVRD